MAEEETSISVRDAELSDCQMLSVLMKESAKEQQIATQLTRSDSSTILERDGFGETPLFAVLIGQQKKLNGDDDVIGYLLYSYGYSGRDGRIVYVEDIFVVSSYRRKGIASTMWKYLMQTTIKKGFKRCDVFTKSPNRFLLNLGAVDSTEVYEDLVFQVNKESMENFIRSYKLPDGIKIRKLQQNECHVLIQAVRELYTYLGVPEAVDISASDLKRDGFGNQPFYASYVAEKDGVVLGYTIFFFTYHLEGLGVFMEDIYVSEEHRGKGIGTALWGELMKETLKRGGKRCTFTVADYNKASLKYYKYKGAVDLTQEKGIRFYKFPKDIMEKFNEG